jgi:hypothetical protein
MFNINFARFGKNLTPWFLRSARNKQWVGVITWSSSLSLDSLKSYRNLKDYELQFTGQTLYLEKWVNDKFDPVNHGFEVENIQLTQNPFVFNKLEGRETYAANKYKSATAYVVGDRVASVGIIYRCVAATTGNTPASSPAFWTVVRDQLHLYNKNEIGNGVVFRVIVPLTITLTDIVRNDIRIEVEKFVIAGHEYEIISA